MTDSSPTIPDQITAMREERERLITMTERELLAVLAFMSDARREMVGISTDERGDILVALPGHDLQRLSALGACGHGGACAASESCYHDRVLPPKQAITNVPSRHSRVQDLSDQEARDLADINNGF